MGATALIAAIGSAVASLVGGLSRDLGLDAEQLKKGVLDALDAKLPTDSAWKNYLDKLPKEE